MKAVDVRALDHFRRNELDGPTETRQLERHRVTRARVQVQPPGEPEVGDAEIGVVVDAGEDDAERLHVEVEDVVPVNVVKAGTDLPDVSLALRLVQDKVGPVKSVKVTCQRFRPFFSPDL